MANLPVFGAYTKTNDRETWVSLVGVSISVVVPRMTESQKKKYG